MAVSASAQAQSWHFTIDPDKTGMAGKVCMDANLHGALKGTWNAESNPSGTMTKPGYDGAWGEDANVNVCIDPNMKMGAKATMATKGSFDFKVDAVKHTATASNLSADLLGNGPLVVDVMIQPNNKPFKTKNPEGHFATNLKWVNMGKISVNKFTLKQNGRAASRSSKRTTSVKWSPGPRFLSTSS